MKRHVAGNGREKRKALGTLRSDGVQLAVARQRVLVWHRPVAQLGAFIAQVACIGKCVKAVERLFRPIPSQRWVKTIGLIATRAKHAYQSRALGGEQQVMAHGVARVNTRQQCDVRQLRTTAERGGVDVGRHHLHAAGFDLGGQRITRRFELGIDLWIAKGNLAVRFQKKQIYVLAAQSAQIGIKCGRGRQRALHISLCKSGAE